MDIEVAVDVLEMAPILDHIYIFSGDGDFRRLVEAVQRQGKRVSIVSSVRTSPAMAADELRRQADEFLELEKLIPEIGRSQNRKLPGNLDENSENSATPAYSDEDDFYNDVAFDEYNNKDEDVEIYSDKNDRT